MYTAKRPPSKQKYGLFTQWIASRFHVSFIPFFKPALYSACATVHIFLPLKLCCMMCR